MKSQPNNAFSTSSINKIGTLDGVVFFPQRNGNTLVNDHKCSRIPSNLPQNNKASQFYLSCNFHLVEPLNVSESVCLSFWRSFPLDSMGSSVDYISYQDWKWQLKLIEFISWAGSLYYVMTFRLFFVKLLVNVSINVQHDLIAHFKKVN